jgi:hypothetical protein
MRKRDAPVWEVAGFLGHSSYLPGGRLVSDPLMVVWRAFSKMTLELR